MKYIKRILRVEYLKMFNMFTLIKDSGKLRFVAIHSPQNNQLGPKVSQGDARALQKTVWN